MKKILAYSSVAAALLLVTLKVYQLKAHADHQDSTGQSAAIKITPGGQKAILRLADGRSISLDSSSAVNLSELDGTRIETKGGRLSYISGKSNEETVINTLTTPRGGNYRLTLPDGSHIWLNASSSVSFPTHFSGRQRKVKLTGEAYFEIAHDKEKPFIVDCQNTKVEVLGTRFNVNAYSSVSKTTLVEGAVKISNETHQRFLKPGEQATVKGADIAVHEADIERALAWKDGMFYFNQDSMSEIMNEISRWYDLEVIYKGAMPDKHYIGNIRRQASLEQTLEMLRIVSDADFKLDGRTLTVEFRK